MNAESGEMQRARQSAQSEFLQVHIMLQYVHANNTTSNTQGAKSKGATTSETIKRTRTGKG